MLSRARFEDGVAESDDEEVSEDIFASEYTCQVSMIQGFHEDEYERETLLIGRTLQELDQTPINNQGRADIQRKMRQVQKFFLNDGLLWR